MLAREAIRKTIAHYTRIVDNARYDELREIFLPDATIAVHGGRELRGHEEIITAFRAGAEARGALMPGNFQRHNVTTAIIDLVDSERAIGIQYVMVITELGFDHCGMYQDEFCRSGNSWLIHHRSARMEWVRPDSRFATWLGAADPARSF